jgi:hypothetical protein
MRTNKRPTIQFRRFAGIRQAYAAGRSARLNAIAAAASVTAPAKPVEATAQAVQTR